MTDVQIRTEVNLFKKIYFYFFRDNFDVVMNTNPVDEDLCANVIFNYFQCKFSGHIFNVIFSS